MSIIHWYRWAVVARPSTLRTTTSSTGPSPATSGGEPLRGGHGPLRRDPLDPLEDDRSGERTTGPSRRGHVRRLSLVGRVQPGGQPPASATPDEHEQGKLVERVGSPRLFVHSLGMTCTADDGAQVAASCSQAPGSMSEGTSKPRAATRLDRHGRISQRRYGTRRDSSSTKSGSISCRPLPTRHLRPTAERRSAGRSDAAAVYTSRRSSAGRSVRRIAVAMSPDATAAAIDTPASRVTSRIANVRLGSRTNSGRRICTNM